MGDDATDSAGTGRTELERQLALLEKQQQVLTNKETLAEVQYKIALLKWRLGHIDDAELCAAEEFHENFSYEADR